MSSTSSSTPRDTPQLKFGIRSAQIATAILLLTLLAALGFAAFRNADARDAEVAFLGRVEQATGPVFNTQRSAVSLLDAIDEWREDSTRSVAVSDALELLDSTIQASIDADPLAAAVVQPEFANAIDSLSILVQTPTNNVDPAVVQSRSVIQQETRTWLTRYQTIALAELRTLSEARATNERNQGVLLLMCLVISLWLLIWVGVSVGSTYQRARQLIAAEELKVANARSALQHASDQLAFQARHDALTRLPNRTQLMERLNQLLATNPQPPLTVFFCDLDRFKLVNDSLGHAMGDDLLVEAAVRLTKAIRDTDFVARFGGDEFVVVCEAIADRQAALRMAERINRALSRPFDMQGQDAFIGVSIGVATSRHDSTANQLLRDADVAMYRAKSAPGMHIQFFDEAGDSFAQRFDTENALRRAISGNELLLHWQPIVNLRGGQVHTLEALVRWQRPGAGLLLPNEFMPIAEDSGLIIDLGRWVLRAACAAGALTDDRSVAVNISAQQLRDVNFVDDLREILMTSGLPAERLIVEITEHTLIDAAVVSAPLRRVRELGVRIALDDFGTGYSSLALLPKLPVDIIKLDRAFLRELTTSEPSQAVVKSLVQLAQAMGLMLIVEGVESDAQRRALRSLGVQHGQGYWFGQPEPGRAEASISTPS